MQIVIKQKQIIKEIITNEAKSQISASTRHKRWHSEIKSINNNETETGEIINTFDKWRKKYKQNQIKNSLKIKLKM